MVVVVEVKRELERLGYILMYHNQGTSPRV